MNYRYKIFVALFMIAVLFQLPSTAQQQMENSMSQYFQSRMLWNASFTGADGSKIYALQNRSWVGFDGAPVMSAIGGELVFGANSTAGLQVVSDVTGLLYRTFGIFNYAYRIKLSKDDQLRIGISLAFASDRLNSSYIDQGGAVDPLLVNSINQKVQFDGNIGFAYLKKKLTLGLSFYRLRENFSVQSDQGGNLAIAQMGGTYNIALTDKIVMKPLLMMRLYKATAALVDIGTQVEYNRLLNTMLVYQTTGNIRAGAGLRLKDIGDLNFFYNTNIKVANAASQQYELGIAFHLKGKNQE